MTTIQIDDVWGDSANSMCRDWKMVAADLAIAIEALWKPSVWQWVEEDSKSMVLLNPNLPHETASCVAMWLINQARENQGANNKDIVDIARNLQKSLIRARHILGRQSRAAACVHLRQAHMLMEEILWKATKERLP